MQKDKFYLLGLASGLAGADIKSGLGPITIQHSSYMADAPISYEWIDMITPPPTFDNILQTVRNLNTRLANEVTKLIKENKPFCVVAGDHTSAIGTWSGAHAAFQSKGEIGLIWIDAHMDSHTPETSLSGRIHGMPLAVLLGKGDENLTGISNSSPKVLPQNVCLIGVRSYESGEAALLNSLNVKIYYMEDVEQRGLTTVLKEAVEWVNKNTVGFGISLDIDSIDPLEAPGVDVPEPNGIHVADLVDGLTEIAADSRLLLTEIVEFDPSRDKNAMTEKVVTQIVEVIAQGCLKKGVV